MKAIIVSFVLLALSAPAAAQVSLKQRDCVYDYTMLTDRECRAYRMKVLKARTPGERIALQEDLNRTMSERARVRGVNDSDWRGLTMTPVMAVR